MNGIKGIYKGFKYEAFLDKEEDNKKWIWSIYSPIGDNLNAQMKSKRLDVYAPSQGFLVQGITDAIDSFINKKQFVTLTLREEQVSLIHNVLEDRRSYLQNYISSASNPIPYSFHNELSDVQNLIIKLDELS